MAHFFFFSQRTNPCHIFQEDCLSGKIRLSIFLITQVCIGPPAVVWALRVLYGHHKSGGRISVLVIVLLLCDLLVLLLNPYIVTKLQQDDCCWESSMICRIFTSLWSGLMTYGFLLQLVVALEGALSLRHPHCSAHVFFPSYCIIMSITGFICFFLFSTPVAVIFTLPLLLIITMITCIVTCRAPPQISDFPYRTKKPSYSVLAFISFTVMLYIFLIICSFLRHNWDLWVMSFSLMSLRVIIDPLLCVLVYRKDLRVQTKTQAEHRTDIELTQIQSSDTTNTHTAQEA